MYCAPARCWFALGSVRSACWDTSSSAPLGLLHVGTGESLPGASAEKIIQLSRHTSVDVFPKRFGPEVVGKRSRRSVRKRHVSVPCFHSPLFARAFTPSRPQCRPTLLLVDPTTEHLRRSVDATSIPRQASDRLSRSERRRAQDIGVQRLEAERSGQIVECPR